MSCKLDTRLNGEVLYLFEEFMDGNPYVLRDGTWHEVMLRHDNLNQYIYAENEELPEDYGYNSALDMMVDMTEVSQHDVEYWNDRRTRGGWW